MEERERILETIKLVAEARQALAEGEFDASFRAATSALALSTDHLEALSLRGSAARQLGREQDEDDSLSRLVAAAPFLAGPVNDLGRLRLGQGRIQDAHVLFVQAVQRAPDQASIWHNLARAEMALDQPAHAVAALIRAIVLAPGLDDPYADLCAAARESRDFGLAAMSAARALCLAADNQSAIWNRALLRLTMGDLAGGLDDYESRWAQPAFAGSIRHRDLPRWAGGDPKGQHVLVWAEQGLGDTIQFARYVPALARRGAKVTLELPQALMRLMQTLDPTLSLVPFDTPVRDIDATIPLGSLARALGGTIPADTPYLAAESARIHHWRDWLAQNLPDRSRKIGLVWQGNPVGSIDRGRSIPLSAFAPLAARKDLALVPLQKRHGLDQIATSGFKDALHLPPPDFDEGADGFLDSAAILMSLDLLITSDTSMAHLAGALGRPCVLLLKAAPDWRWQVAGNKSPWYPSMTLIRQQKPGDWPQAVVQLITWLGTRR